MSKAYKCDICGAFTEEKETVKNFYVGTLKTRKYHFNGSTLHKDSPNIDKEHVCLDCIGKIHNAVAKTIRDIQKETPKKYVVEKDPGMFPEKAFTICPHHYKKVTVQGDLECSICGDRKLAEVQKFKDGRCRICGLGMEIHEGKECE